MRRRNLLLGAIAIILLFVSTSASAYTFDLVYEFDGDLPVLSYGTVDVSQNGEDLDFEIVANTGNLGPDADIHELYFNLSSDFSDLQVLNDDALNSAYTLIGPDPSVAGGGGASFDWGVNFGNGGGSPGNGILQFATFTLSATEELTIEDLFGLSYPNNTPPVNLAVHFQSTATEPGSETVGAAVPIPAAAWLLGSGLVCFIGLRRKFMK